MQTSRRGVADVATNKPRTSSVRDLLLRQLAMLRLVPRHPQQIGANELRARLAELGYRTTARTVQRDLQTFATHFAIECQTGSKPYGWRWRRDAELLQLPAMDRDMASSVLLAATLLARTLPDSAKQLELHLVHARSILGISGAQWGQSFRVLGARPPRVAPNVLDVIVRALTEERCFRCSYELREGSASSYEVHPIAFVVRDVGARVVCTLAGAPPLTTLAAHRIQGAELLPARRVVPNGVDLDAYLRQPSRTPRAG